MGTHYDQVSSHTEDELKGGAKLTQVRVVAFTTKPSGIYAEERFDLAAIPIVSIPSILEVEAQNIEVVAQRHDVAGVLYVQDVNAAGQLIDGLDVIVQSTSGASTQSMTYPLDWVVALGAGTWPGGKNPFTGETGVPIPTIAAELDALEGA